MQLKAFELMQSAFNFLDEIIAADGLYIFVGFIYLLIPFSLWALSGGLRRKLLRGKSHAARSANDRVATTHWFATATGGDVCRVSTYARPVL